MALEQVVVTAMGIKKKAASLTYSTQQLGGDELTRAKDPNMIAALAGNKRWARVVGYALHAISRDSDIPWYRVVKKNGEVFGGVESLGGRYQTELLQEEGVGFVDGYVDMEHYQWKKVAF